MLAIFLAAFSLVSAETAMAQNSALGLVAPAAPPPASAAVRPTTTSEFRGIKLGMGIEEVETLLQKDAVFNYRGPEDVSLLPARNQSLVEATGTTFIKRAFFQFLDGKLWVIIIFLNPDKMDHYSLYSSLVAKYGEPVALSPKEARWEDSAVRMSLERPLTLRYMDMKAFGKLEKESSGRAGIEEIERRDFLGGL